MGRISTYDAKCHFGNGMHKRFLEKTLWIFAEYVFPKLRDSTSKYADDVVCMFMELYDFLLSEQINPRPDHANAGLGGSSDNEYTHEAIEKGKLITLPDGLGCMETKVGRRNIRDYSHPGQYLEEWSIRYYNMNGRYVKPHEYRFTQCTKGKVIYNLLPASNDFIDSDCFEIIKGRQAIEVQISQSGKVVVVYVPDLRNDRILTDAWENKWQWNIWTLTPVSNTYMSKVYGNLPNIQKARGYLSCKIPTANPYHDNRAIAYENGDVIGRMMQNIIDDLESGRFLKPRPQSQKVVKNKQKSFLQKIKDWTLKFLNSLD